MKNLVVLTGAGMSAESGISTFRDAGGLWDQYPVEQVATPEGYAANPKLVIDFYNERRKQLLAVKPNRGHKLVSEMEKFFNVTGVQTCALPIFRSLSRPSSALSAKASTLRS